MQNGRQRQTSDMRSRMKHYDRFDAAQRRTYSTAPSRKSFADQASENLAMHAVKLSQPTWSSDLALTEPIRAARTTPARLMYVLATAVLSFALFVSWQTFTLNQSNVAQVDALGDVRNQDETGVEEGTGDNPSESAIGEDAFWKYKVAPDLPRYIRLPEIGVYARVKHLETNDKGQVDAPWNIHDVAWYKGSVRPGSQTGASLIVGHVSGYSEPGVFAQLKKLSIGAKIQVEKGNGDIVKYEVTRTETLPVDQVDMRSVLNANDTNEHDLKLMSCAGAYDKTTGTYADRLIVHTKRVF